MPATTPISESSEPAQPQPAPSHEEIRQGAYELLQKRLLHRAEQDWAHAEQELTTLKSVPTTENIIHATPSEHDN